MATPARILEFLLDVTAGDGRGALVAVTDVIGGSSREAGTLMAVADDGYYAGSLSGGCVEAAVVAEALEVIAAGTARIVRFGAGSPYIDIRLPCGGAVELLIIPVPDPAPIRSVVNGLARRRRTALAAGRDGSLQDVEDDGVTGWLNETFVVALRPPLRVVIVGHGEEVVALARLSRAFEASVSVLTPDRAMSGTISDLGVEAHLLRTPDRSTALRLDQDSAAIFLFHDHDWEPRLIAQALEQPSCFVGAMGSRATHARRVASLADLGVPQADIDRLVGPAGLIPAARDPETLALSVLAQIVTAYRFGPAELGIASSLVPTITTS